MESASIDIRFILLIITLPLLMIFFWRFALLIIVSFLAGGLDKSLGGVVFFIGAILLFIRWFGKKEGHIK